MKDYQCSNCSDTCEVQLEVHNVLLEDKVTDNESGSVNWSCVVDQIGHILVLYRHANWLTSCDVPVVQSDLKRLYVIEES